MKVKNYLKKIVPIILIFVLIVNFQLKSIYAKTNSNYGGSDITIDSDENSGIGQKVLGFIQDAILGLIGKAIVGLAYCVEIVVRAAVGLLTQGSMVFPWADRVIFNGMALLDVNFINPEPGSLFLKTDGVTYSAIGNAVRSVYFSGLSIALGFLGIIVAVMAIKLAISSIGSEKAKYKEAIVHWVTALVLVFGVHYIIAFVFYINEQLVEVASTIVLNLMTENETSINKFFSTIHVNDNSTSIELLGEYFRDVAVEEWNTEGFTSAILYAVFIVQSLLFFYAYLKRFFYVVILAVIAPFVVVYDFLQKSVT